MLVRFHFGRRSPNEKVLFRVLTCFSIYLVYLVTVRVYLVVLTVLGSVARFE